MLDVDRAFSEFSYALNLIFTALEFLYFKAPMLTLIVPAWYGYRYYKTYRGTTTAARVLIRAVIYAVALLCIFWICIVVITMLLTAQFPLEGRVAGANRLRSVILVGSVVFWIFLRNPPAAFYRIFRIPPAGLDRASSGKQLFFNPQDQLLYNEASKSWAAAGRSEQTLLDAGHSAEARGQIMGAYLDENKSKQWIRCDGQPAIALLYPFLTARFAVPFAILLLGLLLAIVALDEFLMLRGINDGWKIAYLGLNYVFGAMFAQHRADAMVGIYLISAALGLSLLRWRAAAIVSILCVWAYVGFSMLTLEETNRIWNETVTIKLLGMLSGWIYTGANAITNGLFDVVRAILAWSLSNIFGASVVLWVWLAGRATYLSFLHPDGRMWYRRQMERPMNFGRLD